MNAGALVLSCLLAGPAFAAAAPAPEKPDAFRKVALKNATRYLYAPMKALIDVPAGLVRTAPKKNDDIAYQFAFKEKTGLFEVRVQFDALTEDPKTAAEHKACEAQNKAKPGSCFMADLDKSSQTWGQGVAANMAEGGDDVPFFPFPAAGVKKEYGADWGFVSAPFELDPKRGFNAGYKLGQVVVIDRRGAGRIYQITLTDDVDTLKQLGGSILFYSARFEGSHPPEPR